GCGIFLEIGPQPILVGMGRHCLPDGKGMWLSSLRQGQADWYQLLHSLGALYVRGVSVDWAGFDRDYPRRRVVLPTYPFQRQRYWVEMTASRDRCNIDEAPGKSTSLHDSLRRLNDLAHLPGSHFWEIELSSGIFPYLRDHRIQGVIVLPGTTYLAIAQAGADEIFGAGSYFLEDVEFHNVLFLPEDGARKVQLIFSPYAEGQAAFQIHSESGDTELSRAWILHATGKIHVREKQEISFAKGAG